MKKTQEKKNVITLNASMVKSIKARMARCESLDSQFTNARAEIIASIKGDVQARKLHLKANESLRAPYRKAVWKALFGMKKTTELTEAERKVYQSIRKVYSDCKVTVQTHRKARTPSAKKATKTGKPVIVTSLSKSQQLDADKVVSEVDSLIRKKASALGLSLEALQSYVGHYFIG